MTQSHAVVTPVVSASPTLRAFRVGLGQQEGGIRVVVQGASIAVVQERLVAVVVSRVNARDMPIGLDVRQGGLPVIDSLPSGTE